MRVLVIAQYFPPRRSSFASRWAWLTTFLAERGHDVEVIAFLSSARQLGNLRHAFEADPPAPRVRFHPVLPLLQGQGLVTRALADALAAVRGFREAMRVGEVDVVVASVPSLVIIPLGWLVARRRRRPLVLDLRDAWPELLDDWREWNHDGQQPRPLHPAKRAVFPLAKYVVAGLVHTIRLRADAVVVTTERLAIRLRAQGIKRVEVVRNTSAKPWPYPLPRVAEESDELRILYMGNVGRAQLLATAIRAAARAKREGTNVVLRIVGSGPQWDAVRKIARQEDAPVEFFERIPTYEVLDHYRWADSVLVILRDWESMKDTVPSKLYEALLTGRHITASVAGETADLIQHYGAGDVVPPEDVDGLARLWHDLAADRGRLHIPLGGRFWVRKHLTPEDLSHVFEDVLAATVRDRRG